jgi:hypothetical protein
VLGQVHGRDNYRFGYVLSIPIREFTAPVTVGSIAGMDAKTARTENIRRLVAETGGPAEFSRRYGGTTWVQAQVSQWISQTNPKPIGHALARKLEDRVGLAVGSLDRPPEASHPVSVTGPNIRAAIELARKSIQARGMDDFDPEDESDAEIVAQALLAVLEQRIETVTDGDVLRFIRTTAGEGNGKTQRTGSSGGAGGSTGATETGREGRAPGRRARKSA